MGKVFAFHGGIHPPENKKQSTRTPIATAPIPAVLTVPIQQHIGIPAKVLVNVGDQVLKGQMIAAAEGRISASVHAPTSGKVVDISMQPVPHASGLSAQCVVIETDGQEQWSETQGLADYTALSKPELIDFIRDKGIAGMGGAGFPTDVKLHLGDDHIVNTLIINAAECEPYITADDMLMRERADRIVRGIEVIHHLLKPHHVVIGIEDNKAHAIRVLEEQLKGHPLNIDIVVVPTKYPSGGEKQLIKLLTGVEVPSGGIPADVGIVCQNVGTAAAISDAVFDGKPLISRIVTITGDAARKPQNFEALIGTPFDTLLEAADVDRNALSRLVCGGPMMGFTINDGSIPVIKTSNCVIAATADEMPPAPPAQACIRCGMCEQVCPAELLPQQLHWFAKSRELDKAKHHNLFDCIECGACAYVCPSSIPLVQYYRFAKSEIRNEEAEQRKAELAKQRFEARLARQEQEKLEKEARRKARAADAAKAQAQKAAAPVSQPASSEDELKKLKTAAAVARTKLKKAQTALDKAKADGGDDIAQLDLQFQQAQQASDKAAAALASAEAGQTDAAKPAVDTKQLKTAAAVARTKLKKAEKALASAEEKGQDDLDALRATVKELTQKADAAQQALEQADSGTSAPAAPDTKQLKTAAAVARTKLKKAQSALALAQEQGADNADELAKTVAELEAKAAAAQAAFDAAESGSSGAQPQDKTAELQADVDKAKQTLEKAQKALTAAQASGSPAVDKMRAGVEKLDKKYQDAVAALQAVKGSTEKTAAEPELDLKALKQTVSIMRTKLKKAEKALAEAPDDTALADEVARLTQSHDEAKQAFEAGEATQIEQAAAQGVNLKQLKIDAAMARAAVTKIERAIKKASEQDSDLSELETELVGAQQHADKLNSTLSQFE